MGELRRGWLMVSWGAAHSSNVKLRRDDLQRGRSGPFVREGIFSCPGLDEERAKINMTECGHKL